MDKLRGREVKCLLQAPKKLLEQMGLKATFSSSLALPALHNHVHPGSLAREGYSIKYAMCNFDLNIKTTQKTQDGASFIE